LPDTVYAGSAWIAGTAALIKSAYPHLAPALVARAIAISARDHPRGGYNIKIGFGLINPFGALLAAGKLARLSATASPAGGRRSPAPPPRGALLTRPRYNSRRSASRSRMLACILTRPASH
jgi:hypothetical protein